MKNKDSKNKLVQDFNALGWIEIIFAIVLLLLSIVLKDSIYPVSLILLAILRFVIAFLMFRGKKYAKEGSKSAYTYGIVTGILLILGLSIISIILGILVLIDSNNYNKAISEQ